MGSVVEEMEGGRVDYDVKETIFVAVGKNVEKSKPMLYWALRSFTGKRICLLHVHRPTYSLVLKDGRHATNKMEQHAVHSLHDIEQQKMHKLLNEYLLILFHSGVQAKKIWIEIDSVEKGIVEIIARYNIRWLVMGAAADKYYSKKLVEIKSKKAIFVCQKAPNSCHIWFGCSGYLIYTREAKNDNMEANSDFPLLLVSSTMENNGQEQSETESVKHNMSSPDVADNLQGIFARFASQCSMNPSRPVDKAKALESLCVNEICKRKGMEELLSKEQLEVEKIKTQHTEILKELQMVQKQELKLKNQLAETHPSMKVLEEKFFSAVDLLINFKGKRDATKVEYENAERQAKMMKTGVGNFCRSEILKFSFAEINEATHNFDSTWKIGDGKYGSVYKGFIRHVQVAIKMLPSYGSKMEFQKKVAFLCKVRHPNLVTVIGICPDSRSLVYEYVKNGNLEDRLACNSKCQHLSWQTRTRIAAELSCVLVFLHSNNPPIIHGNLMPSKIFLDTNLVCKVNIGISYLIPQHQDTGSTGSQCFGTENLTPASDTYSFGIVLLLLLTGRPVSAVITDVKCALENEKLNTVLDFSANWPVEQAKQLARLALRCCEKTGLHQPDLASEIWTALEAMRVSCLGSLPCLTMTDNRKIPSHFVCPILQEVMTDPHIAADGFTYEAEAIRGWLKSGHSSSPMTNLKLGHCNLVPNYALYQAIQEWTR